jgi:Kef-type K+ transport system membrane component KefB
VLAVVVAIARAKSPLSALYTFLMLLAFVFIMFGLRFLLQRFAARRQTFSVVRLPVLIVVFIMIFVCAWITEIIGVHAIFGAFIWGICLPRTYGFNHKIIERIEDIVVIIFLPLYFTYSGLRTNIGTLTLTLTPN